MWKHIMRGMLAIFFTLVMRSMIRGYQLLISPLLGPSCRYTPSCSAYADAAIRRFGPWIGGWMALARLSRCHPWGACGLDPVPKQLPKNARWYKPWAYGAWTGRHIHHRHD